MEKEEKNRSIIEIAFSWFDPFINILDSETPLPPHPFSRQVLSTAQPVANRHRTDTDIFGDFFNIDPTLFIFIHKPSQSTAARKINSGSYRPAQFILMEGMNPYDAHRISFRNRAAIYFLNDDDLSFIESFLYQIYYIVNIL